MSISFKHNQCFVPLVTPFRSDMAICEESVSKLIGRLTNQTAGLVPCLSTGEGAFLSSLQWQRMVELSLKYRGGRSVIAGVLRPSTAESIEFSKQAKAMGVNGIILGMAERGDLEGGEIYNRFKSVHDAVEIDLFVYYESNFSKSKDSLKNLIEISKLPRVRAIKDSSPGNDVIKNCNLFDMKKITIFQGYEPNIFKINTVSNNLISLSNVDADLCCQIAQGNSSSSLRTRFMRVCKDLNLFSDDWFRHIKTYLKNHDVIKNDFILCDERIDLYEPA